MAVVAFAVVAVLQTVNPQMSGLSSTRRGDVHAPTLEQAQRFFYNGDYDRAAALTLVLCEGRPDDLDACELRTASLLFQIKKALGDTAERDKSLAWNRCAVCPELMSAFSAETVRGQSFARARLKTHPDDPDMLFFLGKVDLNYVWLQLGMLGRKTGWDEYWEARRSLDRVIRMNPEHVRARVARAWVDYIVGSTVPRGVRWLLGGGNKKRGLLAVRQVAESGGGEFFDRVEAMFAFWDMQVRERDLSGAIATAQLLARDFPENPELRRFLAIHDSSARTMSRVSHVDGRPALMPAIGKPGHRRSVGGPPHERTQGRELSSERSSWRASAQGRSQVRLGQARVQSNFSPRTPNTPETRQQDE